MKRATTTTKTKVTNVTSEPITIHTADINASTTPGVLKLLVLWSPWRDWNIIYGAPQQISKNKNKKNE